MPVTRRVAEHAEHVVAQLERLARAEARTPRGRRSRRAGAAAMAAPEQERVLDGVLRGLVADHLPGPVHAPRAAIGRGLLEHVEVLPAHELGPHRVEDAAARARGRGRPLVGEQLVAPGQAQVAGEDRAGHRRTGRRRRPSRAPVQVGERRCRAGHPAGVAVVHDVVVQRAAAWKNSSEVAGRTIGAQSGAPAARHPQSGRRPAAACPAQEVADVLDHGARSSGLTSSGALLLARNRNSSMTLLEPRAQVLAVEGKT